MLIWAGTCSFDTIREGLKDELITYERIEEFNGFWFFNGTVVKWVIFGSAIVGLIVGHIHNAILFSIIQEQKISTLFHNETITKKEVEFCLGINRTWSVGRYYTFSSFKSGPMRMYHRIIFNLWCIYLVVALAVLTKFAPGAKYYVTVILIIILLVGVLVTRPYRSEATNVIYVLGVMGLLI
jgi:hypothetical protein